MILSLVRFGIVATETTYMIEKGWAACRKQKELDLYGKSLATKVQPRRGMRPSISPIWRLYGRVSFVGADPAASGA